MPAKSRSSTTTKPAERLTSRRLPTDRPPTHPGEMLRAEFIERLARLLGMPADFWLGLQSDWDLWHAMHSDKADEIEALIPLELP